MEGIRQLNPAAIERAAITLERAFANATRPSAPNGRSILNWRIDMSRVREDPAASEQQERAYYEQLKKRYESK